MLKNIPPWLCWSCKLSLWKILECRTQTPFENEGLISSCWRTSTASWWPWTVGHFTFPGSPCPQTPCHSNWRWLWRMAEPSFCTTAQLLLPSLASFPSLTTDSSSLLNKLLPLQSWSWLPFLFFPVTPSQSYWQSDLHALPPYPSFISLPFVTYCGNYFFVG
jgi:hypothetical protein